MTRISPLGIGLALVALTTAILAQTAPPPPSGWTQQSVSNAIVLTSPGLNPASRVALLLLPPRHPQGDVKAWFGNQVMALAQSVGQPLGSTEIMEQDGILVRVVQVEDQHHKKVRDVFYGYPTATGFSMAVLTIPPATKDQDPRLETATRYVQELAAGKFEVAGMPASAPPQVARSGQGQYVGPLGRSDIDLTYHAKAIIPKDRDVPLRGTYVFVGYAYGASYGGVGHNHDLGPACHAATPSAVCQRCGCEDRPARRKSGRQVSG